MKSSLLTKFYESFRSVFPITLIVIILHLTVCPMPHYSVMLFVFTSLIAIVGMTFFTYGSEISMMEMGQSIGNKLTSSKKSWLILGACFILGFVITLAEPDLLVLASQVDFVLPTTLVVTVALGTGIFLLLSSFRILYKKSLALTLSFFYLLIFAIVYFVPASFIPLAFDSGGVTTGVISTPFIIALGIGLSSLRSDRDAKNDSFGLIAMCSIGPILAILILGLIMGDGSATSSAINLNVYESFTQTLSYFVSCIPAYLKEIILSLLPILIVFIIFQVFALKMKGKQLRKVILGLVFTYLGLVIFLVSVNVGFIPIGYMLGIKLYALSPCLAIGLGMVMGYFIVAAEPAVLLLTEQIEEVTSGSISKNAIKVSLSIAVAISVGLAIVKIIFKLPIICFLIPGYLFSLIMMKFTPKIFTSIAFDSGGVSSGAMATTFLLPFALGVCLVLGGNVYTDGFGIVAMIAMTPLITIQFLGLLFNVKTKYKRKAIMKEYEKIIDYDGGTL